MSDTPKTPDERAKEIQTKFQNAINPEEPKTAVILNMGDHLERKIASHLKKAEEYKVQAIAIDNNSSDINKNPFAAPLLKRYGSELDTAKALTEHLDFIRQKEFTDAVLANNAGPALGQIAQVIKLNRPMNWGMPGMSPTK